MKLLLRSGLLVDGFGKEEKLDLLIEDGKITDIESSINDGQAKILDCEGKIILPGLIDFHLHFREPGIKNIESISQGIERALLGGFTGCLMMPNTEPPIDSPELVRFVKEKAAVFPEFDFQVAAAITKNREGKKIAEMGLLKEAGVKVLTDDGSYVQSSWVMSIALRYASAFDLVLMQHPEEQTLCVDGQINEGKFSALLGLTGLPKAAEEIAVMRDLILLQYYPAKMHFTHVSTAGTVDLINQAKKKGFKITFDLTPHHLLLTEEKLISFDANFKMKPPLRNAEDREALAKALAEKKVDIITTDHSPHSLEDKEVEFEVAGFGVVGLDTALALVYQNFVLSKAISLTDLSHLLSLNPAKVLGLKRGIKKGFPAFITVFDPNKEWVYQKSKKDWCYNSPFLGKKLKGKAYGVIANGKLLSWEEKVLG